MEIFDLRSAKDCIPQLAEWHHREWAYLNPGSSVQKRIEKMQAYLGNEPIPSMFVCKHADSLLGSAGILANDMDTKMELSPWLASVYVAQDHRNRGIGSALVRHVLNQAKEAGYSDLYLFTPNQERFYESLGWFAISRERYRGEPVTVMQFKLGG